MSLLLSTWPVWVWLLPAAVLLSAVVFLSQGRRRCAAWLLALVACYVVGALLMEFFVFIGALMARPSAGQPAPELGTGTLQLLRTLVDPRSLTAPPLSLPAIAAYSVIAAYLWLAATWVIYARSRSTARPARKTAARAPRKSARA